MHVTRARREFSGENIWGVEEFFFLYPVGKKEERERERGGGKLRKETFGGGGAVSEGGGGRWVYIRVSRARLPNLCTLSPVQFLPDSLFTSPSCDFATFECWRRVL